MHGWVDSEISAIILALIIIVLVSLAFAHHVTLRSNPKPKKNQKLGIGAGFFVEREEQFEVDSKSMLGTNANCVICQNPTTRRCSRCKSMRYWYYSFIFSHLKRSFLVIKITTSYLIL